MRSKYLILSAVLAGFFVTNTAHAETVERLTGKDWLAVSEQRKLYFIFGTRESTEYQDVVFSHSVKEYIDFLDDKVSKNPELKEADMSRVFRSVVDEKESRNSISNGIKKDPKIQKIGMH